MYSFITGILEEKNNGVVVINNNGIGYEIMVSNNTIDTLPSIGEVATIYTYLHVREDVFLLFGFATKEEKEVFLQLTTVSGVGSKTAIGILSGMSPEALISAILLGDTTSIGKIKGIGKKTAERIVLELKSSLGNLKSMANVNSSSITTNEPTQASDEAILLLSQMGLTKMEALQLVNKVAGANDTTEEIVTKALKNMN